MPFVDMENGKRLLWHLLRERTQTLFTETENTRVTRWGQEVALEMFHIEQNWSP